MYRNLYMLRSHDRYYDGDDSVEDLQDSDTYNEVVDPLVDGRSNRPLNLNKTGERGRDSGHGFIEDFDEELDAVLNPIEREELYVDTLIELEDLSDESL